MRTLQVSDVGYGIDTLFAEITELAPLCKFRDCTHVHEPGCAVQIAIENGTLDGARVENRKKLEREQEFQRRKSDPEAMHDYKTKVSRMMRGVREKYRQRDKEGKQ